MFPSGTIVASDRQTGLYVLRSSLQLTGVGNNFTASIPEKYSLEQNFPNPFNPGTVIRYSLSENRFITLKVYNQVGEEVSTLVNEKQNAGNYNVNFDASNLPSGIYYYTLNARNGEAGNFTETKKMTLLK
jgi:endo-1,4-beta-xylanase